MRWIRLAPVTAESLMICVAIFVGCSLQATLEHERFENVQREWGAICSLELFENHDGVRRTKELELHGPFDVWDGGWWRIPVTVFHHTDLFHLVLNLGAAWYLGRRLEWRWGRFGMALFLVPAICIPVMSELCFGQAMMGFSGVNCAMLGALVALRHFDDKVAEEFPVEIAEMGMATIMLCWFATLFKVEVFANAAHLTGFVYGALIAGIVGGPLKNAVLVRAAVILAHLWLVLGPFEVSHPFWIGRYHWYRAMSTRSHVSHENFVRFKRSLEKATRCDPSLTGAWLRWSQLLESHGELSEAWRQLVRGLYFNPSSAPLMESARRMWRHLDAQQRREAEVLLAETFGPRSAVWLNEIRASLSASRGDSYEEARKLDESLDSSEFSLNQKLDLPRAGVFPAQPNRQELPGLVGGNDAVEGETL